MSAMTFTLKTRPEFPVDISALVPDKLAGKSRTQISAMKIGEGNRKIMVSTLFSVSGNNTENIRIQRSCRKLTHIGQGMKTGKIQIRGDVGDFLGKNMQGGQLQVIGNTGDWAASGLNGGLIEIDGNTGDHLAANYSGKTHGMSDGTIIVTGNAGNRVAERMRRGMMVIFGDVGEYCANRMLAGSVVILGKTGAYLGYGMKRGTIALTRKPHHITATFRHCGLLKIEFLRLFFKQMATSNNQFAFFREFGSEAIRYAGDVSCAGKGEILILRNARRQK